MIDYEDGVFYLTTENTSYWFRITEFSHLEHIYYGKRIKKQPIDAIAYRQTALKGSQILYDKNDPLYCLDNLCLEWSNQGIGDYRESPCEIKMPDKSYTTDFVYKEHKIIEGHVAVDELPTSYGEKDECKTLEILLEDKSNNVFIFLYYAVYEKRNVIARRCVVKNGNKDKLHIRKIMSMMVDMPNKNYKLMTFDGDWIKEANKHIRDINYGTYINSSSTGASSNRHNPGFIIASKTTTEENGEVYGFNIIYSGNHYGGTELSSGDMLRVFIGINPRCFEWTLKEKECFYSPEAIMSYSNRGYNGLSQNFHNFINNNIVRGQFKNKERPTLINSWEAYFFKFTKRKLLKLAKKASKVGIELFVLDDGWFGKRNDDTSSLGDYNVNNKKLPGGLKKLAKRINKMGMKFGLWFEPEMINEDSELYRNHKEYVVSTPDKKNTTGRNQLVLDLCNKDVRDYIVENVGRILDEVNVEYVKWDMNRHISDAFSNQIENQGEFYHRYILGLYEILDRIFTKRPHILLETCSSGGNRFDLGMLCFSPQIWASDNTDPVERLKIQEGLSYLYPLSTIGAHVSATPHQQTLRKTSLSERFNVSAFGLLGYELDLGYVNYIRKKEIKRQIEFYKKHRKTFQYGSFSRVLLENKNQRIWQCKGEESIISGFFQEQVKANPNIDRMKVIDLEEDAFYRFKTVPQRLFINRFGELVKHILPFSINPEGLIFKTANKFYSLWNCVEEYVCTGSVLNQGIILKNQFMGTYYNEDTRMLGDFGSNLYTIMKRKED